MYVPDWPFSFLAAARFPHTAPLKIAACSTGCVCLALSSLWLGSPLYRCGSFADAYSTFLSLTAFNSQVAGEVGAFLCVADESKLAAYVCRSSSSFYKPWFDSSNRRDDILSHNSPTFPTISCRHNCHSEMRSRLSVCAVRHCLHLTSLSYHSSLPPIFVTAYCFVFWPTC